jgi:hypothetical protein
MESSSFIVTEQASATCRNCREFRQVIESIWRNDSSEGLKPFQAPYEKNNGYRWIYPSNLYFVNQQSPGTGF